MRREHGCRDRQQQRAQSLAAAIATAPIGRSAGVRASFRMTSIRMLAQTQSRAGPVPDHWRTVAGMPVSNNFANCSATTGRLK